MNFCLGYIFNSDMSQVILIKKNRPESQKGKFNGIGGKIETDIESPRQAMERECKEETGLDIYANEWIDVGTIYTTKATCAIAVFYYVYRDDWYGFALPECAEGDVQFWHVRYFYAREKYARENLMENVLWTINFIIEKEHTLSRKTFLIQY